MNPLLLGAEQLSAIAALRARAEASPLTADFAAAQQRRRQRGEAPLVPPVFSLTLPVRFVVTYTVEPFGARGRLEKRLRIAAGAALPQRTQVLILLDLFGFTLPKDAHGCPDWRGVTHWLDGPRSSAGGRRRVINFAEPLNPDEPDEPDQPYEPEITDDQSVYDAGYDEEEGNDKDG